MQKAAMRNCKGLAVEVEILKIHLNQTNAHTCPASAFVYDKGVARLCQHGHLATSMTCQVLKSSHMGFLLAVKICIGNIYQS